MEVIDYTGNGVLSGGGRGGSSARYGKPEIFNTDQGSQFTSIAFTGLLLKNEIKISMDGKGAWRDNIFVERLWGGPSNTRRCTYGPTPASRRHGPPSADISTPFTMPEGPIRALTGGRRMRPTSLRCSQSRLQHNHGRNPLSRSQPAVQTNRASSFGALVLQQTADFAVGIGLRNLTPTEQLARFAPGPGLIYAALLAAFAAMPLLRNRQAGGKID